MKGLMMGVSSIALGALIGVSWWATERIGIGTAITQLFAHASSGINPWFIATLFDAYFGFLWFWLWVAYKEPSWIDKILWLVLILALGNIAMAGYVLLQLTRLPPGADFEDLLLRRWA